jgi:hypothetical protein
MFKFLIIFILLPIFLFSKPIATIYNCDDKASFYLKVVGDFPDNDVTVYWAGQDTGYKWIDFAEPNEIHFFRDKLVIRDGRVIIESPYEAWWGYAGNIKLTKKNGDTSSYQGCVVTFE